MLNIKLYLETAEEELVLGEGGVVKSNCVDEENTDKCANRLLFKTL